VAIRVRVRNILPVASHFQAFNPGGVGMCEALLPLPPRIILLADLRVAGDQAARAAGGQGGADTGGLRPRAVGSPPGRSRRTSEPYGVGAGGDSGKRRGSIMCSSNASPIQRAKIAEPMGASPAQK